MTRVEGTMWIMGSLSLIMVGYFIPRDQPPAPCNMPSLVAAAPLKQPESSQGPMCEPGQVPVNGLCGKYPASTPDGPVAAVPPPDVRVKKPIDWKIGQIYLNSSKQQCAWIHQEDGGYTVERLPVNGQVLAADSLDKALDLKKGWCA